MADPYKATQSIFILEHIMNNIEKIKAVAAAAVNFSDRSEYQELLSHNNIPVYDTQNEIHKLEDIEHLKMNLNELSYNTAEVFNAAEELNRFIIDEEYITDIDDAGLLLFLQERYLKKTKPKKDSDRDLDSILGGADE